MSTVENMLSSKKNNRFWRKTSGIERKSRGKSSIEKTTTFNENNVGHWKWKEKITEKNSWIHWIILSPNFNLKVFMLFFFFWFYRTVNWINSSFWLNGLLYFMRHYFGKIKCKKIKNCVKYLCKGESPNYFGKYGNSRECDTRYLKFLGYLLYTSAGIPRI